MQRDVTYLRNIGIMASIDAGNARCRDRILELISTAASADGEPVSSERFAVGSLVPARVGTWTPRSGPFADESVTLTVLEGSPRALDGALLVLDGARGTAETAETAFRDAFARRVPCIAFIDDVGSVDDLDAMVSSLESDLGVTAVAVHLPWRDERGSGVIDILEQRFVLGRDEGDERELCPVPAAAKETVARMRRRVVDVCAEIDESILGASAGGLDLGGYELARALRKGTLARDSRVLVVTSGSLRSRTSVGVLLDAVVTYLPSPAERPPVFGVDPRRSVKVARFARPEDALAAFVFATSDVPSLGRLTCLRIYSGTLQVGDPIVVLPRDEKARVERIFVPEPGWLVQIEDAASAGAVVCITGPTDTQVGDTVSCVRAPVALDEAHVPPPRVVAPITSRGSLDGAQPSRTGTVWSVARGLQSSPAAAGLRRSRG